MYFEKIEEFENLEMAYVCNFSGGFISKNKHIMNNLKLDKLTQFILSKSVYGTPVFKIGDSGNKILITSGIHGNELPPQIANVYTMSRILKSKPRNTLYFIPFASPKSTMNNERTFNSMDLNRSTHIKNSVSNLILDFAIKNDVSFIGDFHSTAYNSNPGCEAIFSSQNPSPESYLIANYVAQCVDCKIINFEYAGGNYKGAVEDVFNLNRIPAITAEVLSPFASVGHGSVEKSIKQMESFLSYFGEI